MAAVGKVSFTSTPAVGLAQIAVIRRVAHAKAVLMPPPG
jgi:hypothetical protein